MKKAILIGMIGFITIIPFAKAQIPIVSVFTGAAKRIIRAIDLEIQRQQNKVIWLQNAQKALENTMSKMHLDDISNWTQKQKDLYSDYFAELRKVKDVLATYNQVKDMVGRQKALVNEYATAWNLLNHDPHFSAQELRNMASVYQSILSESLEDLEQMEMVVTSFATQMSDGQRLALLSKVSRSLDKNIGQLRRFNDLNFRLSVSRAASATEANNLKSLYGIH